MSLEATIKLVPRFFRGISLGASLLLLAFPVALHAQKQEDLQLDLFHTYAKIAAAAQTTGDGTHQAAVSASRTLWAPIPVAGPQFRLYLTNSPRVFIEGNVYGMYLFGYGNFVSSAGDLGFTLTKHITANAGYQLGTRLNVNNTPNRIGLDLAQKGPIVGLEFSF